MIELKLCDSCFTEKEIHAMHKTCGDCDHELTMLAKHMHEYTGIKTPVGELKRLVRKMN